MSSTSLLRTALAIVTGFSLFAASAATADAQTLPEQKPQWQFLVSTGSVHPTGVQREALTRGKLTAAQLTYVVRPALAFNATIGWARSRDIAFVQDAKLDVFTYDLGAEVRANRWIANENMSFSPFAGVGAGARSYNYRSLDVDATHNAAAYGSAGAELGYRRVRLRVEARDYVTGFKPLDGAGSSDARNDVVVMVGLRFVRR